MSDSFQPHGLQHIRVLYPSPALGACSNSCPLSQLCHLTISFSVVPFSFCLQAFPTSGSFLMSQFFTSGCQSTGASGLISFMTDWLDLLAVQGTLKSLLQHHNSKASILWCSVFFIVQPSHPYISNGKISALTRQTFVGKIMSLFLIFCLGWSQL